MLDPKFVILAILIDLAGTGVYVRDTVIGVTKPNRVTWLLWAIIPLITFAAQVQSGANWPALFTLALASGPILILAASFVNKQAYWKITRFDVACGVTSALALFLWWVTKTGTVAIIISIIADALAGLPTIIKSYRFPATESSIAYLGGIISTSTTLLSIKTWTFANYSFAAYALMMCVLLYTLIKLPHLRIGRLEHQA